MSTALGWLADTLAKRLFWLMWVALVASHFAAYLAVSTVRGDASTAIERLPTMPALPPMSLPSDLPPWPDGVRAPEGPPRAGGPRDGGGPPPPRDDKPGGAPKPGGPPGLPWPSLLLDYGVRFVLIALAAWFGSRWLARPMKHLVGASQQLGTQLASGRAPLQVDEREGTREVREAASVFNRMARQLKEQFDARGLMISAISHDLRTPLTRMRMRLENGNVERTLRERCTEDIREMDALIGSVLELFRGQHEGAALQRTDVGALAQSLVDDLAEHGARVEGDCPSAVAMAEPAALKRVLGNLIGNGLRYGTHVRVSLEHDERHAHVLIDDDGPGIPDAQLEAVFEPFYRVESSRSRASGGTGLGLYIARQLTQSQNGTLTLANRAGGGLRARVSLLR